jgi:hypothetical protein
MRTVIVVTVVALCLGFTQPVAGQQPVVRIGSDPAGMDPDHINDSVVGPIWVYVLVYHSDPIAAVSFSAPIPDCFPGATYIADEIPFPHITGNSQTGITIGFGQCIDPQPGSYTVAMRIMLMVSSPVTSCCWYPPLPNPETGAGVIEVFDCSDNPVVAGGASGLVGQGFPPQVRDSYPSPGATGVPLGADLSWMVDWCSVGLGVGWSDVYFGTDPDPPLVAANSDQHTYDPGPLSPGET